MLDLPTKPLLLAPVRCKSLCKPGMRKGYKCRRVRTQVASSEVQVFFGLTLSSKLRGLRTRHQTSPACRLESPKAACRSLPSINPPPPSQLLLKPSRNLGDSSRDQRPLQSYR